MSKFKELEKKLEGEKHPPDDPAAVAAAIGRKKYGEKGMEEKAKAGEEYKHRDPRGPGAS